MMELIQKRFSVTVVFHRAQFQAHYYFLLIMSNALKICKAIIFTNDATIFASSMDSKMLQRHVNRVKRIV